MTESIFFIYNSVEMNREFHLKKMKAFYHRLRFLFERFDMVILVMFG